MKLLRPVLVSGWLILEPCRGSEQAPQLPSVPGVTVAESAPQANQRSRPATSLAEARDQAAGVGSNESPAAPDATAGPGPAAANKTGKAGKVGKARASLDGLSEVRVLPQATAVVH